MLAEAKAFGALAKAGWKPKRTIVYASWDAEETGLIGSTEWAETHADELKAKGVIYINTDGNGRGFLGAGGSHDYQTLVNQVAAEVKDPQTGVSVGQRLRAKIAVDATAPGASETLKANAKLIADPAAEIPIGALGSGSDYSAFLQHLGLASLDIGYGGEGESGGVYHSLYDDYAHHSRFVDPGFVYDATLAKTVGRLVWRVADADLPVQRFGSFADTMGRYLDEVKKLSDAKRDEAATQARLLAANAYGLAADPTQTHVAPVAFAQSPEINFAPLASAIDKLKASAGAFDTALAAKGSALSKAQKAKLDAALRPLSQRLMRDEGLPAGRGSRTWSMRPGSSPATAPRPCRACARRSRSGASTTPSAMSASLPRPWPATPRASTRRPPSSTAPDGGRPEPGGGAFGRRHRLRPRRHPGRHRPGPDRHAELAAGRGRPRPAGPGRGPALHRAGRQVDDRARLPGGGRAPRARTAAAALRALHRALQRPYRRREPALPRMVAALETLKAQGAKLAVCTNKLTGLSVSLLDALGLSRLFDAVVGADAAPAAKPDPRHLEAAIAAAGGSKDRAIMVGDAFTDAGAARAAGVPLILVSFGYTETPAAELKPDILIDHFDELPEACARLLGACGP